MPLVPKILCGGEFHVDALSLEDYANLATQIVGIARYVESHDLGAPAGWNHQRGKIAKQRCFAATIWAQQSKQLSGPNVERHTIQRGTVTITVHNILHRNNRWLNRNVCFRAGDRVWCFGSHRLFYDEIEFSAVHAAIAFRVPSGTRSSNNTGTCRQT